MERRNTRDRDDRDPPRRSRDDDDRPARGSSRDEEPRRGSRSRDDDDRGSSRSGSRFEYKKRDDDTAKKRADMGGKDYDQYLKSDAKPYKPGEGNNTIRILPPTWAKPDHYGYDIWVHYSIGPDKQTYLCNHKMKGEPCPICEERAKAQRSGDEDYAKELEPKRRVLMYLIDRDKERDGVHVWAAPWTIDRDITQVSVDKASGEVLPIDSPEEGYDISYRKDGKDDRTKYSGVQVARRDSALGKDSWLDFAVDHPLPTILNYFDYEHIAKEFGGGGDYSDRNDRGRDRDDTPARGRGDREPPEREVRSSRGGDEGRRREPDLPSWDDVHDMTAKELDALIEEHDLSGKAFDNADSDEELADAICEALDITKLRRWEAERERDDDRDRLRDMKRR
jgi:hypothetical protein